MSETTPPGPFILTAVFDDVCYITETDSWSTDPWDSSIKEFDSVEEANDYINKRFPTKNVGIVCAHAARDDYGSSLQQRSGSECANETTRPEWARGPEWEGWEVVDEPETTPMMVMSRDTCIIDTPTTNIQLRIEFTGLLFARETGYVEWHCKSPAHALTAANALASAAGGWA